MEIVNLLPQLLNLITQGSVNELNSDDLFTAPFTLQESFKSPSFVIHPANDAELSKIIQFANENDLNVTVTSSTGPHRKGGINNNTEHLLIDLSHWKKIDLIDRRNRVCRVEPGVTYDELLTELAKHGMTLPTPLAPRNGKSVLAAVMDREPSIWPNKQWDSADPVASTNFYFGSGECFTSGSAGGPGTIEKQRESGGAQKFPDGPSQTGFHRVLMGAQGTMGLVNWITLRTELLPTVFESFLVGSSSLLALIDYMYAVQRRLLGEQSFILNKVALTLLMAKNGKPLFTEYQQTLPDFICLQTIGGFERLPKERLKYQKIDIKDIAETYNLKLESEIDNLKAQEVFKRVSRSCGEQDWRDNLFGACCSVFFLSTLDRVPEFLEVVNNISLQFNISSSTIGLYIQPMVQNHHCHIEIMIPFDPADNRQQTLMRNFEKQLTDRLMEKGAFFNRPYGTASESVWNKNSGNTRLVEIIKSIFDPNNILQKGKWFSNAKFFDKTVPRPHNLLELAIILGEQWISTSACLLDTYAYYMNPETINEDGSQWLPRPAAVVLPDSTEAISEIMRFCSKSQYMAKPISTGFHAASAASNEDVIILDLKRMNKINEIDYKNQIAVIEPYVKAIDLQTVIVKQGLNCHIVSCGANHSLLASHTAAWGYGTTGASTSFSGRNLLGLEWVLPTGEVITLGSAGSGCGWFTADGPGPSMRGIVRGFQGTFGGLGVFTRCAIKLFKWDGPREWEIEGKNPKYFLKKIPPRCSLQALAFPSRKAERDAGYKMGEAELNHGEFRTPMFFTALGLTENNDELKTALESGIFHKIGKNIISTAFFCATDGEFKWKKKALKQILRETGGVLVPINLPMRPKLLKIMGKLSKPIKDPLWFPRKLPFLQSLTLHLPFTGTIKREKESVLFWILFRNANNTQAAFRPSQGMATMLGSFDTWDLAHTQAEYVATLKQSYIKKGLILDDGGDLGSGGTFESGHLGYLEGIILYDPGNPESAMAARDLVETGIKDTKENAMGIPIAVFGEKANSEFGPSANNYHIWLRRIKEALDPNTASDPFFYAGERKKLRS